MKLGSQPTFIRRGFTVTPDLCPRCGAYKPSREWKFCRDCTIRLQVEQTADRLENRDRAAARV